MLEKLLRETFLKELDEIKPADFVEPDDEIRLNENAVGEMNDLEKAVFTLMTRKSELEDLTRQRLISDKPPPTEKEKLEHTFFDLAGQRDALYELMWVIIRERFNLCHRAVGIRKGFKVVWYEGRECPLKHLFKGLPAGRLDGIPEA